MRRRDVLAGLAAGLALPWLEGIPRAHAAPGGPKRFLLFLNRQGTVMTDWLPTGGPQNFTLPAILEPLQPWQDRLTVIAGLDNRMPDFNSSGNGHDNAELTLLTGMPFQSQGANPLQGGGPSFEQLLAEQIGTSSPFQRLDLAIGGGSGGGGLYTGNELWHAAGDPVTAINDPLRALTTIFGSPDASEEDLAAQRARRGIVLDAVKDQFGALRRRLGTDDRVRLDAHLSKLEQLEARVTGAAASCSRPTLTMPTGYDHGLDDDVTAPLMIDLMVAAMACDQTRVGTMVFANSHDPTFPWLDVNGAPLVPTGLYDNWHGMVHDGRHEPGLVVGFRWYQEQLAMLLERMANTVDSDGDNLLDTTLVLWTSEFGNGSGHNTIKIPAILAGCVPGGAGRFVDFMNGGPDDDYVRSDHTTNQLWVSILQAFGVSGNTFGLTDSSLPTGPLPGL